MQSDLKKMFDGTSPGSYLLTFDTGESMPRCGVRDLTVNQYLGSANSNVDKTSILGVTNLKERKILPFSTFRWPIQQISFCMGAQEINSNVWGFLNIRLNIWGPAKKQ